MVVRRRAVGRHLRSGALALVLIASAWCAGITTVDAEVPPATARPADPAADAGSQAGERAEPAGCPDAPTIVTRLQARYDTTRAFRADFRQQTTIAAVGTSEEARGRVAFKKPGKMRWEFEAPDRQSIVSDGTTLWIYQPADRQVLKAAFAAAFVSTTPVSFLTGMGRITEDFRPEADPRGCRGERLYVRLVARAQQDVGSLTLAVDRTTFDIVEAAVTDPLGNVTTLVFANQERNVEIPDGEFRFEVPPGIDVITAPSGAPG